MDAGTYNVVKATCIMRCTTCHGATSFWVQTVPFGVAVSNQKQLNSIVQYDSGSQSDLTTNSSWASSAASIASVSSGLVAGLSPGGVNITATSPTETQAGTDCQPYTPPPCPRTPMQSTGGGTVGKTVSIFSSDCFNPDPNNGHVDLYAGWGTPGCLLAERGPALPSGGVCKPNYSGIKNCYQTNNNGCQTTYCPGSTRTMSSDCLKFLDSFPIVELKVPAGCQ
jgi:hypothetical protein